MADKADALHLSGILLACPMLQKVSRIVLEHEALAVTALIYNELPHGAFTQHVVRDYGVFKVLAHDAVVRTKPASAIVVAPGLEIVAHTVEALCALN